MAKPFRHWFVLNIQAGPETHDSILNWCFENNSCGNELKDDSVLAYFENSVWDDNKSVLFREYLRELVELNIIPGIPDYSITKVDDAEWTENWKKFFKPKVIGRRLFIVPPWEQTAESPDRKTIIIEPGMAFGTGDHASTEMALELIDKYIVPGQKVWDIGTGTGILAIAAAKLGSGRVYSNDNDPLSIESALKNFELNGVSENIEAELISAADVPNNKYGMITANLYRKMLIENSKKIHISLISEGIAILSGIETPEKNDVLKAYLETGYELMDTIEQKGWCGLAFTRRK